MYRHSRKTQLGDIYARWVDNENPINIFQPIKRTFGIGHEESMETGDQFDVFPFHLFDRIHVKVVARPKEGKARIPWETFPTSVPCFHLNFRLSSLLLFCTISASAIARYLLLLVNFLAASSPSPGWCIEDNCISREENEIFYVPRETSSRWLLGPARLSILELRFK